MNIFFLSTSPIHSANYLCDKHIVKMIVESAQMLSTAHRETSSSVAFAHSDILYKSTHVNHGSTIWTMHNTANYMWLYEHMIQMGNVYKETYGKTHKTITTLADVLSTPPDTISVRNEQSSPYLAMPEVFKTSDPIYSYTNYYRFKATQFKMVWSKRDIPFFMRDLFMV